MTFSCLLSCFNKSRLSSNNYNRAAIIYLHTHLVIVFHIIVASMELCAQYIKIWCLKRRDFTSIQNFSKKHERGMISFIWKHIFFFQSSGNMKEKWGWLKFILTTYPGDLFNPASVLPLDVLHDHVSEQLKA